MYKKVQVKTPEKYDVTQVSDIPDISRISKLNVSVLHLFHFISTQKDGKTEMKYIRRKS